MRPIFVAAFVLVLAPFAAAAGTCVPSCDVLTNDFGFAPAIVAVTSGATVTWTTFHAITPSHTATSADHCLDVPVSERASGVGTFTIAGGQLVVTTSKGTAACVGATALPGGSFALPYVCTYHAQMVGRLVITPGVPT